MTVAYRLHAGDRAPRQQKPTTCGAACLTIARMLVDPPFARWVVAGEGMPFEPKLTDRTDLCDEDARFAAYEELVHARTTSARWFTDPNLPWPRSLGTPPQGARTELERAGSRRGTSYETIIVREDPPASLRSRHAHLVDVVADGAPALLYVGGRWLPRHVTLVLPGDGDAVLDVYDPTTGRVTLLDEDAFAGRRLGLGGWPRPWFVVQPCPERAVRVSVAERVRASIPARSGVTEAATRVAAAVTGGRHHG